MGFDPSLPGTDKTVTEIRACERDMAEQAARGLAVALDAVYAAMATVHKPEAELTPEEMVNEAQVRLRHRIHFPGHNRELPDLEDLEADAEEERSFCQSCLGTGRYLAGRCPDCQSDECMDIGYWDV